MLRLQLQLDCWCALAERQFSQVHLPTNVEAAAPTRLLVCTSWEAFLSGPLTINSVCKELHFFCEIGQGAIEKLSTVLYEILNFIDGFSIAHIIWCYVGVGILSDKPRSYWVKQARVLLRKASQGPTEENNIFERTWTIHCTIGFYCYVFCSLSIH